MCDITWKVLVVGSIQFSRKTNTYSLTYCDFCPFFFYRPSILCVYLGAEYQSKAKEHLFLLILCMLYLHACF